MTPQELEKRINKLEDWKEQKERHQLTMPLDVPTRNLINQDLIKFKTYDTTPTADDGKITVIINGINYYINVNRI